MNCPYCLGPIYVAEEEKGFHVRCGSSFCSSILMQEGEWGLTEQDAYEHLLQQYELHEVNS